MTIDIIEERDESDGVGRHFYTVEVDTIQEALQYAHEVNHEYEDQKIIDFLLENGHYNYNDDYYFSLDITIKNFEKQPIIHETPYSGGAYRAKLIQAFDDGWGGEDIALSVYQLVLSSVLQNGRAQTAEQGAYFAAKTITPYIQGLQNGSY